MNDENEAGTQSSVTTAPPSTDAGNPSPDAGTATSDAPGEAAATASCKAPADVSASPSTLTELLELLNALPQPLSLPCFLESLERPLAVTATYSIISAQPALTRQDPRVFLKVGDLYISLVTGGEYAAVVEFSQMTGATRSYKAELEFPLLGPVEGSALTDRIMWQDGRTLCSICHRDEVATPDERLGVTFETQALRPEPKYDIPLDELRAEKERCDAATQPDRCAVLRALFDHGPVEHHDFSEDIPLFQ